MTGLTRCPACKGKKTIMTLGMLEKKCTPCLGIGMIEVKPAEEVKEDENNKISKRGRKASYGVS